MHKQKFEHSKQLNKKNKTFSKYHKQPGQKYSINFQNSLNNYEARFQNIKLPMMLTTTTATTKSYSISGVGYMDQITS